MNSPYAYLLGVLSGIIISVIAYSFTEFPPVEAPMVSACAEIGYELYNYDGIDFKCRNQDGKHILMRRSEL